MQNNYKIRYHKRGWILRVDTFQAVSACGKKSFCGEFHIVITLGGRKNSEKIQIL
jgi:hypothetical protein